MAWEYSQSMGTLYHNGNMAGQGYSGASEGKNNPSMQAVRMVGPIPEGEYTIESPRNSARVGPYAMPLTPQYGTNTFGRDAFYIHGDSVSSPGSASSGCVILNRAVREQIWSSGDRTLKVVR